MQARMQKRNQRIQVSGVRSQGSPLGIPLSKLCNPQSAIHNRRAATLTEVLMSLMIMSIGLVSLATMFPLATIKAIQATQLSQATNIRYNAEAMLDAFSIVQRNGDFPLPASGDVTRGIFDPYGWRVRYEDVEATTDAATALATANQFGSDPANILAGNLLSRTYGANTFSSTESDPASAYVAENFTRHADNWFQVIDVTPEATAPTASPPSVTLSSDVDLSQIAYNGKANSRITLFDTNGLPTAVRKITNIDNSSKKIEWVAPLVNGFIAERVVIETQDGRYSWLATIRRREDGSAAVDVVVFFNRSPSADDERLYACTFTPNTNSVTVSWPADAEKPLVRKGGYIFDAENARWYRIQDITSESTGSPGTATLTLDRQIHSEIDRPLAGQAAMLMPGVVEVFPIGTK